MGKKMEKVKEFGKKHWKGILIGSGLAIIGGGAIYTLGQLKGINICEKLITKPMDLINIGKESGSANSIYEKVRLERIAGIEWDVGVLEDITEGPDFKEAWVDKVPITKMGELGKELLKLDGATEDTKAWTLISFTKSSGVTEG